MRNVLFAILALAIAACAATTTSNTHPATPAIAVSPVDVPSAVEEQCQPHKVAFDGHPGELFEPEEGREGYRFYAKDGKFFACTTANPEAWRPNQLGGESICGCALLFSNCAELCLGPDGKFMWP